MKNFINFLPPWVETNLQPAFYDKESGSCLQQTARMYAKVNQLVRIANEQYAKIEEYIAKFVELKDYVEDYFENLDVQNEIDHKLDEMASDGSLGTVMSAYLQPYVDEVNNRVVSVEEDVIALKASYGTPLVASTVAGMTNHSKIYVYTGSEAGYTAGHWYYWDGDSWEDGGAYQSMSVSTDKTLTLENTPADALYTGLNDIALSDPAKVIQPLWANKSFNRNTGVYTNSTKNVTTTQSVNFDDFVEVTPPAGFKIGAFLMESTPVLYSFQVHPITLTPNKDWVLVLQDEDNTQDIPVTTAKKLHIEYGGTLSNAMLIHGETTSYNFDANKCKHEGRYTLMPSTAITLSNFPRNNAQCVLVNEYAYKIPYSASSEWMFQTVYYYGSNEVWRRLISTKNETEYSGMPWTRISPSFLSTLAGKKVSFYGDSITTYAGYIPTGNATYYTGSNAGVTSVDQTWWKETIDALDLELLVNNSWSGRRVSDFGRVDDAYKQANIDQLSDGVSTPDIIIVKLGVNDFNNNAPLGDYDGSQQTWGDDMTVFSNAYATMLDRIMTTYPDAKVYCCTLNHKYPEWKAVGSLATYNERIVKIAKAFGADIIRHDMCGMTKYNLSETAGDYNASTGNGLHPNAKGMSLMANKTIDTLDNQIRKRY